MIADASLSNAFDDLADLFLGGPVLPKDSGSSLAGTVASPNDALAAEPVAEPVTRKPLAVEGLVLGHLPLMGSLWASQYVRMAAVAENGPVALVRLDHDSARVELFNPPHTDGRSSRIGGNGHVEHALSERQTPELSAALRRAAQVASRIVVYSSLPADELLLARSSAVRSMALLTGADDASAVGAYKAIKRLGSSETETEPTRTLLFRIAVMGSEEHKATAAFHRLADAARSFLELPIEFAGHCRQIAGGVPGTILFEGPSAMTTQAVLESLTSAERQPAAERASRSHAEPRSFDNSSTLQSPMQPPAPAHAAYTNGHVTHTPEPIAVPAPVATFTPIPVECEEPVATSPVATLPQGLTQLPIRCPFDRDPVLAIDAGGLPQVVATATAGESPAAAQRLLAVGAWLWTSRELLAMVCPTLRTDAKPVLHLVTDRPTDVNRLIDSDLRLHIRIPPATVTGTLPLN